MRDDVEALQQILEEHATQFIQRTCFSFPSSSGPLPNPSRSFKPRSHLESYEVRIESTDHAQFGSADVYSSVSLAHFRAGNSTKLKKCFL